MITKPFLDNLAGILMVSAFIPLVISIIWRGYAPPKSSWIVWGMNDTIIGLGMYQKGTLNGQMIGALMGVWVVIGVLLKFGKPGWTTWQKLQIVIALVGVTASYIFRESNIGIATGCSLLLLGGWDSWEDAYLYPEGQKDILSRLSWTLFWLSCIAATGAAYLSAHTFAVFAQPITFLVIESGMMYLIFVHPVIRWWAIQLGWE